MHPLQNSLGQLDHIPQPGIVLLTAEIVNKPLDLGLLLLRRDKDQGHGKNVESGANMKA